jgi:hypothetical protein
MVQQSEFTSGIEKPRRLIRTIPNLPQASFGEDTLERYNLRYGKVVCWTPPYLGVDVRNFLDRASFARATMSCGHDTTISALTKFFDELVLRVYHEGRV